VVRRTLWGMAPSMGKGYWRAIRRGRCGRWVDELHAACRHYAGAVYGGGRLLWGRAVPGRFCGAGAGGPEGGGARTRTIWQTGAPARHLRSYRRYRRALHRDAPVAVRERVRHARRVLVGDRRRVCRARFSSEAAGARLAVAACRMPDALLGPRTCAWTGPRFAFDLAAPR